MKKEAVVVMLPTKNPTFPCLVIGTPELGLRWTENKFGLESAQYFHLYTCTTEQIKEGDWFYFSKNSYTGEYPEGIYQAINDRISIKKGLAFSFIKDNKSHYVKIGYNIAEKDCFKVIATTNSSLSSLEQMPSGGTGLYKKQLPSISQSFINKYIEQYNSENKIEKVMVEYNESCGTSDYYSGAIISHVQLLGLKLNGNEIVICEEEEKLYTRKDMEDCYACGALHAITNDNEDLTANDLLELKGKDWINKMHSEGYTGFPEI